MIYDFFTGNTMIGDKTLKGKEVVNHRIGNTMTGDTTLKGKEVVNHRTGNTMTSLPFSVLSPVIVLPVL
jgi:hypothetical protein